MRENKKNVADYHALQYIGRHPYVASSCTVRNVSRRDRTIPAEILAFGKVNLEAWNLSGR